MDQPAYRLIRGERRGRRDEHDDHDAGEVFGSAVAVGVALGRESPADHEGDAERHRGERVGQVVQRVSEERDRAREDHHDRLQQRRRTEHRE